MAATTVKILAMTPEELNPLAKALEAAKDYADAILKPPLEQIGGLLADAAGYWRLKNRVNVLLKAKAYCEDRGLKPEKLLPNIFVPLLDEAGNTDDPDMSDMFAELLTSHLDPDKRNGVHPSFGKTLAQLGPLDARIMKMIDRKDEYNVGVREKFRAKERAGAEGQAKQKRRRKRKQTQNRPRIYVEGEAMWNEINLESVAREEHGVTAEEAHLSIANLRRLGLIEKIALDVEDFAGMPESDLTFTAYGRAFLMVTNKPGYWRHRFLGKREELFQKGDDFRRERDQRAAAEARVKPAATRARPT